MRTGCRAYTLVTSDLDYKLPHKGVKKMPLKLSPEWAGQVPCHTSEYRNPSGRS